MSLEGKNSYEDIPVDNINSDGGVDNLGLGDLDVDDLGVDDLGLEDIENSNESKIKETIGYTSEELDNLFFSIPELKDKISDDNFLDKSNIVFSNENIKEYIEKIKVIKELLEKDNLTSEEKELYNLNLSNFNIQKNNIILKVFNQLLKEDNLLESQEETEESQEETEESQEETEESQELKENKKEKYSKLLINKSNEIVKNLPDELRKKFDKFLNEGKTEAEQVLFDSNPELKNAKEEDINSLVNTYILLKHRTDFEDVDGLDELVNLSLQTEYKKVFENIFEAEDTKVVDTLVNKENGFTNIENQVAKGILIPDGNKTKIDGNKIISESGKPEEASQIIELSENEMPKKFISKYGYKLETTQTFITDTGFEVEKEKIKGEKTSLNSREEGFNQMLKDVVNKNYDGITDLKFKEKLEKLDDLEDLDKKLSGFSPSDGMGISSLRSDNNKKEIKDIEKYLSEYVSNEKKLIEDGRKELDVRENKLQEKENSRVGDSRERQKQADKKAEETIDFLHNLGLTEIPQEWMNRLFEALNRELLLDPELNLDNGFVGIAGDKNYQKNKMYEIFSKLYEASNIDVSNVDKSKLMKGEDGTLNENSNKIKLQNLLFNENGFDYPKILNILRSKPEEKTQEKTTPNKEMQESSRMMMA